MSIDLACMPGPQQQPHRGTRLQQSIDGTVRRTDTVPLHRPAAIYASSVSTDLADNDASKTNEKSESRVRKIERVINSADARAVDFRSRPAQCDLGFLAAVLHPADSAATHVISRHHVNSPQYTVGQKSKLVILSKYVNKTEKIVGT